MLLYKWNINKLFTFGTTRCCAYSETLAELIEYHRTFIHSVVVLCHASHGDKGCKEDLQALGRLLTVHPPTNKSWASDPLCTKFTSKILLTSGKTVSQNDMGEKSQNVCAHAI